MTKFVKQSEQVTYTHSDFLAPPTPSEESLDIRHSIARVARVSGSYSEASVRFGIALANAAHVERNSRIGHQDRLRLALGQAGLSYPPLTSQDVIARQSFINFSKTYQQIPDSKTVWDKVKVLDCKGLASELGQVEQFGLWNGVEELDAAVGALTDEELLDEVGLELVKEYDYDGEGKIDYEYRAVNADSRFVSIERMRPSRDYRTKKGHEIDGVKSSLFVLDTEQVSEPERKLLGQVLDHDTKQQRDARVELGTGIIEPFMVDPTLRNKDFKLFPVSAIHFLLVRHR